jgi:carbon-monoxide dehydrogenase medium subunit
LAGAKAKDAPVISPFVLHQPDSVEDAAALLAQYGEAASVLAGGSDLVLAMKRGRRRPAAVIDLKAISELRPIAFDSASGAWRIGALATLRQLEQAPSLRTRFPLLAETARQVGSVRLRNVATLGGNLCAAHPRTDPGTLLLGCGAAVDARSARGVRTIPLDAFFAGGRATALHPDEVLTAIVIPDLAALRGTYHRFSHGEGPLVGVALLMACGDGMGCTEARLAVGVGATPVRLREVEESLAGESLEALLAHGAAVGRLAARCSEPIGDFWGSVEYKRHLVEVLVVRALNDVCRRSTSRD